MPRFPAGVHLTGGRNGAPVHRALAQAHYAPILATVADLRRQGLSLRAIALELERRAVPTRHGFGRWHARQVTRILARAGTAGTAGEGRSPTATKVV
jgi:hypothetical protein